MYVSFHSPRQQHLYMYEILSQFHEINFADRKCCPPWLSAVVPHLNLQRYIDTSVHFIPCKVCPSWGRVEQRRLLDNGTKIAQHSVTLPRKCIGVAAAVEQRGAWRILRGLGSRPNSNVRKQLPVRLVDLI